MRAFALVMTVAIAAPAAAGLSEADERRKIMRSYAKCIVDGYEFAVTRRAIEEVTNHPPLSEMAKNGAYKMGKSWCPVNMAGHGEKFNWLEYSPGALRGQLFRALYVRREGADKVPVALVPALAGDPPWRLPSGDDYRPAQVFGECVVRQAPVESAAAVLSKVVGTPEEDRAYAALRPALGQCVPPGVTLRLTRAFVEAALAEALYHVSANVRVDDAPKRAAK